MLSGCRGEYTFYFYSRVPSTPTSPSACMRMDDTLTPRPASRRQVLPAIAVGTFIISIVMVLNGTVGARLHVGFPVLNRSSFGFWFSYFSVVSRCVLAMFWFGIQTYTGSECVYQMLKAIWPSLAHLHNGLSPSANITTSGLSCPLLRSWVCCHRS